MKKKFLSILTSLALCLSLLPTAAFAEDHICADEDGDHQCDKCWTTVSHCEDADHDHFCDTCGGVTYHTEPLDNGTFGCAVEGCAAVATNISADYTKLFYHKVNGASAVDVGVEITVTVPNFNQDAPGQTINDGTVSVRWTYEEDIASISFVEQANVVDGKASVSFADLPVEALQHGELLYMPADRDAYLPASNGLVPEYQENVHEIYVSSNVDFTLNGVEESSLYLFSGQKAVVEAQVDVPGSFQWSYDEEEGAAPDYVVDGRTVTLTMPGEDVSAEFFWTCETCSDEDGDHWCDVCRETVSECADENGDHYCDICDEHIPTRCEDGDADHCCDTCQAYIRNLCADENGDHICDICDSYLVDLCTDENGDHYCDICEQRASDCAEYGWDDDNVCDVCGKGIYPSASALNLEAEAGDGQITLYWDALENVGHDSVAGYTVYCYPENSSFENAVTDTVEAGDSSYLYSFFGVENDVTYEVGIIARYTQINEGYDTPFEADASRTVTPTSPNASFLLIGDTVVLAEREVITSEGSGWSYDADSNTLTLKNADITAGYAYERGSIAGIYADGDLNILLEGSSTVNALSGTSASDGIFVEGSLFISGSGSLTVSGGDISGTDKAAKSRGITVNSDLTIAEAAVTAKGGNVTVDGDGNANSCGVYAGGSMDIDCGAALNAIGGDVDATVAFSNGIYAQNSAFDYTNLSLYDGALYATGGKASGALSAASVGVRLFEGGLYVCRNTAISILAGGEATVSSQAEADKPYACSNAVYAYGGDVGIDGGNITMTAGSWSGLNGDGYAVRLCAYTEESDSCTVSYGGSLDIACEEIIPAPNGNGLMGTTVTITAADGPAIYAEGGIDTDPFSYTMTISSPEGGTVMGQGETESKYDWVYYTVVDGNDVPASSVVFKPLTYTVTISGLSYGMAAKVPADRSLNETYCEAYGVEDFSGVLPTQKDGYTFGGWYTDEACTAGNAFSFDEAITADMTIYAKWTAKSSGGSSSNTSAQTTKNEDGSTTTTTTNQKTGTVTTTTKTAAGVTGTVVTDKNGHVTEISAKVPASAAKADAVVTLPLQVEAAKADKAVEIKVDLPASGASVEIPVADVTPGTVAVIVKADGTEEIVTASAVTQTGVVVRLTRDATVKIVNNSKTFADVHGANHWASDAIDFVTARSIFGGTSDNTFNPDGSMTRQAMWMVLARMSGETPANMDEAKAWAVKTGISDGSNPTAATSRQQFVTFLWRWAKSQNIDVSTGENTNILSYADAFGISEYAIPAYQWACGAGVVGGYADGTLKPEVTAARAHAAKMMMNFLNG